MAPHLVPGWLHNPGWHCASTALSDATAFLGHPLSEPALGKHLYHGLNVLECAEVDG